MRIALIVCDALRFDHVSKDICPNIWELARKGTFIENCYCQFNQTIPSTASILTGTYPIFHKITELMPNKNLKPKTIQELLPKTYFKAAVTTLWYKDLSRGMNYTYKMKHPSEPYDQADKITAQAVRLAREHEDLFLHIHYFDPHYPYRCPRKYADMFFDKPSQENNLEKARRFMTEEAWKRFKQYADSVGVKDVDYFKAWYKGEIYWMDMQLSSLLEILEDDSLIILTSDHGEALGEHGIYFLHNVYLHTWITHVPLIIYPRINVKRTGFVEHVDIAPTILDYLELPSIPLQGSSLLREDRKDAAFSQESRYRVSVAIRFKKYNAILTKKGDSMIGALYDLERDPLEQHPIADQDLWREAFKHLIRWEEKYWA